MYLARIAAVAAFLVAVTTGSAGLPSQSRSLPAESAARPSDNQARAIALYEEGQTAQESGDNAGAVRLYTGALTLDSSLYQIQYQRAIAYIALNKNPEAESDLRKVIQLAPGFSRAHRALGQLLLDRGLTDEAKRELSRAIEIEPKLTGVRVYLASALIKSTDYPRAADELRSAIQQGEATSLSYALLGVAEERQGHQSEAFIAYTRAVELNPDEATAREGRGRIFAARGELPKAIEEFSRAYRSQPSPDCARTLASLHARVGQAEAAMRIYRQLATEKPDDITLRLEIVRLLIKLENTDEALREVELLIGPNPNNIDLLVLAGDVYSKVKPDTAVDYYKRALALKPANNAVRVQLAASLVRSRQFAEAFPLLADVLNSEPDNYQAHANVATALFELKQFPRAAAEFVWLIKARPDLGVAYYFLAICFDRMGDCEQALAAYEEFLRRADPVANKKERDDAAIRVGLLRKLAKDGKCKTAKGERSNREKDK